MTNKNKPLKNKHMTSLVGKPIAGTNLHNKLDKYKVVNEKGDVIATYRNKYTAICHMAQLKLRYGEDLEIKE